MHISGESLLIMLLGGWQGSLWQVAGLVSSPISQ